MSTSKNQTSTSQTINVIGSGVLGLTCALELARGSASRYQVNVVTAEKNLAGWSQDPPADIELEPDFASPWAAAYWHPFGSHPETELEKKIAQWESKSFEKLWRLSDQEPSIVMKVDLKLYYDHRLLSNELPWFMDVCPEARKFNAQELEKAPEGKVDGITCKTVSLNPIRYLAYLRRRLAEFNVKIIHHRLKSVSEAFLGNTEIDLPPAEIVINASGLGAANLDGVLDSSVEPIRGQTVLIRPPKPISLATRDHEKCTYIVSRPSTIVGRGEEVILGGSYEPGKYELTIDQDLARKILTEALKVLPNLSHDGTVEGVKILKHIVALRPGRKEGPRLEAVNFPIISQKLSGNPNGILIHCYGIGGAGFQVSYGMAEEVKSLVEQNILS